ncbi:PPE family protein [Mycobacterium montefiorense]|uniref:PPE family protein n=1 Tax=Mycobacterium montefiorense TaxID=154654 RepID=A0AA37UR96_9MYCO|nr:PPE family protein [Mycobacterium montefiorense]GBG36393.1 PPE family protein [Mycobacterium montefiorense]GKU37132.1 PPE family protein [Mycobacterium montefiorense]GKU43352.1 PPE family protein [Mycobacterium montefiorense]GKU43914.1 PPE family protein [Mycobacterium montefiorense]GKU53673.1 PPE family protein [Mycobacterium montefiorense]
MLNFGALPPEINSAKMYAGPGPGSLLAAAAAWNVMAAEIRSAATNYDAVIKSLVSEGWLGPASAKMAAAIGPYLAWLDTTAIQAEQAGAQANAAAAAFEAAFAATVPPPLVAANRALQAKLLAGNIFGQNTPAIAATDSQYGEMWAQDTSAMTSYTSASRAASQMTPFSQPRSDTTADATALQANAVLDASNDAGANAAAAPQPTSIWDWLGLSPNSNTSTTGLAGIMNFFSNSNPNLIGAFVNNASVSGVSNGFTTNGILNPTTFVDSQVSLNSLGAVGATTSGLEDLAAGLGGSASLASAVSVPGAAATAGLGQASLLGALSVPPTWAGSGATVSTVAATTQVGAGAYHSFGAATPMVMEEAGAVGMPGVPLVGLPGSHEDEFADPIYGFRPRVVGRPPAAG